MSLIGWAIESDDNES